MPTTRTSSFTCFNSTKVQILTPRSYIRDGDEHLDHLNSTRSFTCFTGTKVQMLTQLGCCCRYEMATSILITDNADIPHLNARLENLGLLTDSQAKHLPEYMHPYIYVSIQGLSLSPKPLSPQRFAGSRTSSSRAASAFELFYQ